MTGKVGGERGMRWVAWYMTGKVGGERGMRWVAWYMTGKVEGERGMRWVAWYMTGEVGGERGMRWVAWYMTSIAFLHENVLLNVMPTDVAEEVLNRCMHSNASRDGPISVNSPEYRVEFVYEFLDDYRDSPSLWDRWVGVAGPLS